jgi:NAD kinase
VTLPPRVVTVTRRSELDELLARHGTLGAAGYFLRQRGRDLAEVRQRHDAQAAALTTVGAAVPADWRRGHVDRDDLPRFLFGPEDIVLAVGQDGLVANVAKYLDGQPVIGVDPEPERNPGVLVQHAPAAVAALLGRDLPTEQRAMVVAELDDGQRLYGLNEVYIGQPSHQSARYVLGTSGGARERQSSSGIVVGTGTGATGWCASIARALAHAPVLPGPTETVLCWFIREAWPSPATGTNLTQGQLSGPEWLELTSESERLVAFADGLEGDHLALGWGQRLRIGLADRSLRIVPRGPAARG